MTVYVVSGAEAACNAGSEGGVGGDGDGGEVSFFPHEINNTPQTIPNNFFIGNIPFISNHC
jgi:hypothetical protein